MMPNLDKDALTVGSTLILPHMIIYTINEREGCAKVDRRDAQPTSDYQINSVLETPVYGVNCREYLFGGGQYNVMEHYSHMERRVDESWTMFQKFVVSEFGTHDIISCEDLINYLKFKANNIVVRPNYNVDENSLAINFGLNVAEITKLTTTIKLAAKAHPDCKLDIWGLLGPFTNKILKRFLEASHPIDWWIIDDPGRQYTGSRNPRFEHPSEWYGSMYVDKVNDATLA